MNSKSLNIALDLKEKVDKIFDGPGSLYVTKISQRFTIPSNVTSHYFKFKLSNYFRTKDQQFDKDLAIMFIFPWIFKYLAFLFTVLAFSKKQKYRYKYSLLIDDIQSSHEIERWIPLRDKFTNEETVFIAKAITIKSDHNNIITHIPYRGYDRNIISKHLLKMIFPDLLWTVLFSFKIKLNLVYLYTHYLNDYLYYASLFKICSAEHLIQDRNLGTANILKNFLFKRSGGISTSCLQKNIAQHNGTALYYDIDNFFSYGDKTTEDILSLGANISNVIPVGSMAMENKLIENRYLYKNFSKDIDILFIGLNTESPRTDWHFNYQSLAWLAKLSNEFPHLYIGIKHHSTWRGDVKESKILEGSNVKYLDADLDSYELGFKSNFVVTYGSSMGYELIGCGLNVHFLDPENENPFINNFVYDDNIIIKDYEDLKTLVVGTEVNKINQYVKQKEKYCYSGLDISNQIFNFLVSSKLDN